MPSNFKGSENIESAHLKRSARRMHTMCLCIPLRMSTWFHGVCCCLICLTLLFIEQFAGTWFYSGYDHRSRVLIAFSELGGVVFGVVGAVGAWRLEISQVTVFYWYQVFRLLANVGAFICDFILTYYCEMWIRDVDGLTKSFGFNKFMYNTAINENCPLVRAGFIITSVINFAVFVYLLYMTDVFLNDLRDEPMNKYVLQGNQTASFMQDSNCFVEGSRTALKPHRHLIASCFVEGSRTALMAPGGLHKHSYKGYLAAQGPHTSDGYIVHPVATMTNMAGVAGAGGAVAYPEVMEEGAAREPGEGW